MTYLVCQSCRYVYERGPTAWNCPSCWHEHAVQPEFPQRIEAEAYAVSLWLKEGYSIVDIGDPYFKPRR